MADMAVPLLSANGWSASLAGARECLRFELSRAVYEQEGKDHAMKGDDEMSATPEHTAGVAFIFVNKPD
ncbi:hypothetical protein [Dyella choica]|uniref:Uncharacterized protein n=1 Tax=Dyella choica TaxID=1927959 RepID=A0A432M5P4_9GAMM|nr:hypothetical protein [Dyella choica]RUL75397.1 hypothetical protein EKH80_11810 [Dyella choica]